MALTPTQPKKIYIRVWENSSGIYRNQSEGLISISSDGTNWITITDKNLGATTPYTYGDTLSNANCGNIYQWGNNYGFAWSGGFTTTTTLVDASNYGPGNYYNSGVFIHPSGNPGDWSSVGNGNLWGDTTDTLVARKGPCASDYHIPSKTEWGNLITTMTALGISSSSGNSYSQYLKIPYNGYYRWSDVSKLYVGSWACLWSSSPEEGDNLRRGWNFWFDSGTVTEADKSGRASGLGIRPFKNTPEVPDSTWTVIYQPS